MKFEAADPPKDPAAPAPKGARKVIVLATEAGLTKDDAVKALGTKASRYVVHSWSAPAADPATPPDEG